VDQTSIAPWGWGWFALAVVTAGLAEQKHRSRLAWFLLALVFGPLATVFVVVAGPAPAPVGDTETPADGDEGPGVVVLGGGLVVIALTLTLVLPGALTGWWWGMWGLVGLGLLFGAGLIVLHVAVRRRLRKRGSGVPEPGGSAADAG
jgi:hypothetical protein